MIINRRVKERAEQTKNEMTERRKDIKAEIRKRAFKKAHKWRRMMGAKHMWIGAVVVALITVGLSYSDVLHEVDRMVSDVFYQSFIQKKSNSMIKIISVDKKTVKKYGNYEDWSRSKTADLIETLNENKDLAPSAIGIDLDYSTRKDAGGDRILVDACSKYNNICLGASAIMEDAGDMAKGNLRQNKNKKDNQIEEKEGTKAEDVQVPFSELYEHVTVGIVNNTMSSKDGYVRNVLNSIEFDDTQIDGFATAIYKMYRDSRGEDYTLPKLEDDNSFEFTYTRQGKEYTVYSFADVIEGKITSAAFDDCIVFVGDYTTEGNTINAPNQRNTQMHEIEMQANILEALLEQRTGQQVPKTVSAVFFAIFMALFFITTSYSSDRSTAVIALLLNVLQVLLCWILTLFGYYINMLVPMIMIVLITVYNLIVRYVIAIQNQYAMEDVFKKYVDESVISELGKSGLIEAHIGVASKDIAVLFVDIRGFTSLSESLPPEQIVEILNHYLALVEEAVSKYQGTLDKFIGDAAMAVFNSPVDLEDYEFRAVCAALDLRSNAEELNEKCKVEYGKQVAFGIGIQCGEAVIGNIGCEARMDFTAIGDTVNTASRLEGVAAPGQILISQEMKRRLEGRIRTVFAGEYELKGKKNAVAAYSVEGL